MTVLNLFLISTFQVEKTYTYSTTQLSNRWKNLLLELTLSKSSHENPFLQTVGPLIRQLKIGIPLKTQHISPKLSKLWMLIILWSKEANMEIFLLFLRHHSCREPNIQTYVVNQLFLVSCKSILKEILSKIKEFKDRSMIFRSMGSQLNKCGGIEDWRDQEWE